MGEVYKARDTRLDRTVALKILPEALAADPQFRERFHREARAIAALDHPHICALHDVGEERGTLFLVMQYLEGDTLAARLARGALPVDQALQCAIDIASALDRAHRAGITHRDLKPGNIMLTKSGARLRDFGLAKHGSGAAARVTRATGSTDTAEDAPTVSGPITAEGTILGTFQYMAPEQIEGGAVDARTDIFAFGAVLHEMLTGRRAFDGKSQASLIGAILKDQPPVISTLQPSAPHALDRIVTRCLAKDPEDRWQTVRDLLTELKWTQEGLSILEAPRSSKRVGRVQQFAIGGAVALALALLSVAPLVVAHLREPEVQVRPIRFSIPLPEGTAFGVLLPPVSVSPDGRFLAFPARTAGVGQIWLHRLDEVGPRPLPGTDGVGGGDWPIWSPDSRSLAFHSSQGQSLKRVDVAGGPVADIGPLPVSGTPWSGTWARDGEILLAAATSGILRMSADTGHPVPVRFGPETSAVDLSPVFLSDGRRFLFSRQGGPEPGIYLGSLDSSDARRLLPHGGTVQVSDGFIVYSRESAVVAHPFDERRGDLTGDPVVIVDNVSSGVRSGRAAFTVSENGLLAYTSNYRVNSTQLTWFSRTGQRLGTIGEAAPFSRMAVSPDERTVVVGRVDRNGGRSLWTVEPARQVMTRLTFGGQGQDLDDFPRWSPDGKRLIYGGTRAGDTSLYEIPAGGGQPRVVLKSPGPFAEAEDWSPDGRTIVYRLSPQLWALPLQDGAKPFLVYERGGAARFSPDGKWLAFDSNESGIYQVNVVPFPPTGAKWQVSADGGEKPQWRRDGRELFFLAPDGKMMAVDVRLGETFEAGAPRTLFQAVAPTVDLGQYAATGDGQRFLIMMPAESTYSDEIQVIVDWPGLIQKR